MSTSFSVWLPRVRGDLLRRIVRCRAAERALVCDRLRLASLTVGITRRGFIEIRMPATVCIPS